MPAGWGHPIHPLRIVKELQDIIGQDMTLCVDMGSFHIWIARYLYSSGPARCSSPTASRPWGGAALGHQGRHGTPGEDHLGVWRRQLHAVEHGAETAVRLKSNIVHIIWVDNGYNMVAMQEEKSTAAAPG